MSSKIEALKAQAPESEHGNFYIRDSIGVPHPYMIGPAHVAYAADKFGGLLSKECIEAAERNHVTSCNICKGKLTFAQHEQAVVIGCKEATQEDGMVSPELHAYLLKLKPLVEADFAGFAFMDERPK